MKYSKSVKSNIWKRYLDGEQFLYGSREHVILFEIMVDKIKIEDIKKKLPKNKVKV